ncbi:MAG TPA: glycosyltransferase family 4 protein [Terriglobales bacterium]|nr:glycosyltransferase family 4 protein [Terriglobales bacterium]
MRIGLIAPPFISVPPKDYGGTELFIAQLAEGLKQSGLEVVVYTNGESTVDVEKRWIYPAAQWPIKVDGQAFLKDAEHTAWAMQDGASSCDLLHVHATSALTYSRFVDTPIVCTLHGPHEAKLSEIYAHYPQVHYVCISDSQCRQESMPRMRTIHHGIDLGAYELRTQKQQYLSFIGRIAPIKGVHLAIDVAKRAGIPLKIAGDVQPAYREYFEAKVKPQIDGHFIEYIGLADLRAKNELLGNSLAMLFPIQWNEPFGLVMVEAMACGTPVLALPGGSVAEVVQDGVSGYVCRSVRELAKRVTQLNFDPAALRRYVEENFSLDLMVGKYAKLYSQAVAEATEHRGAA